MRGRLVKRFLLGLMTVIVAALTPLLAFGYTINYTYDDAYRLTQAVSSRGYIEQYSYDEVGNRLTYTLGAPAISLSGQSLAMGSLPVDSPATGSLTISNSGTIDLAISSLAISGPDGAQFGQSNTCGTIRASATCAVTITFLPASSGPKSAALVITSNDPQTPSLTIPLTGAGASTLTVAISPASSGSITGAGISCPSDCTESYITTSPLVSLTEVPNNGYRFTGWTGDVTSASNPLPLSLDTSKSVTANFVPITYTITSSAGSGGTISPSGSVTVDYGSSQKYSITPKSGYTISALLVDGISVGALSSYTFSSVKAGHTIAASFSPVNTLGVIVATSRGTRLSGIKVYLFRENGTYLNLSQTTDSAGGALFSTASLPSGNYKIRADYLGYQFWSPLFTLPGTAATTVTIADRAATLTLTPALSGIKTYLFTGAGTYVSQSVTTDSTGRAVYDLPAGKTYKIRADYMSQQYWSATTTGEDVAITIPMSDAAITVTGCGLPLSGVKVYVFNQSGTYLNVSGTTDSSGTAPFHLPAGSYKFRADYQAKQFWSAVETLTPAEARAITISTGGGRFTLTLLKNRSTPLAGAKCYVFNQGGSPYLNMSGSTDANGQISFNLSDGDYQIRIDHLGHQFWSDAISIPQSLNLTMIIPHKDIVFKARRHYQGDDAPIHDAPVYLFGPSGSYLNMSQKTDSDGAAVFSLPDKPYLARTDYMGQQYWSDPINYQDAAISVPEGMAHVHVNIDNQDIAGNRVYVYGASGSYLNVSAVTDSNGLAEFRLPESTYTFRTDIQSQQLKITAGVETETTTAVEVAAPATAFTLHTDTGSGALAGVKVYVFNDAGTYLNISGTTDATGMVSFNLINGRYKFRLDYLGYQNWTNSITIPDLTEAVLSIPHNSRAVTVHGVYGIDALPIANITVYLFSPSGAYLGVSRTTNGAGQASFSLPDVDYRIRADYLGGQFWSEVFHATDVALPIGEGIARLILTKAGVPLTNAKVYLFSDTGAYLGRFMTPDAGGAVEFTLPAAGYTFRIDEAGQQHWSGLITVSPDAIYEVAIGIE